MTGEVVIEKIEEYIEELQKLDINKIAFTEINERRAEQIDGDLLELVHFQKLELLSYKDSIIYKIILRNIDFEEIYNILLEKGFEIKRISRNIT